MFFVLLLFCFLSCFLCRFFVVVVLYLFFIFMLVFAADRVFFCMCPRTVTKPLA